VETTIDLIESGLTGGKQLRTKQELETKRKGLTESHANEKRPETNVKLKGKISKVTFA
jgi:hypothetical protein